MLLGRRFLGQKITTSGNRTTQQHRAGIILGTIWPGSVRSPFESGFCSFGKVDTTRIWFKGVRANSLKSGFFIYTSKNKPVVFSNQAATPQNPSSCALRIFWVLLKNLMGSKTFRKMYKLKKILSKYSK
uniref:(northern house mosquito) hypothetical protein n=1 Tax=Culex pipiens TaxID=7175 RepID=A0A8D8EZI9_CULPI